MRSALGEAAGLGAAFAGWAVVGAVASLVLVLAAPRLAGGQSYAVLSDSMRGTAGVGDQVIVLPRPAGEIEPGHVVAFEDPGRSGALVQHRAHSVREAGGGVEVVTRADAGEGRERWSVPAGESVGRVVAVVPEVGYLTGRLGRPAARAALIAATGLCLAAIALLAIWSPASGRRATGGAR